MDYNIYIDGSCSPNPGEGGSAVVLCNDNNDLIMSYGSYDQYTTNNQMEMTALLNALKLIEVIGTTSNTFKIYCDSNLVVQGISTWIHNWNKNGWYTSSGTEVQNKDLWILIDQYWTVLSNVTILKIKAHAGYKGNELADQLCNEARLGKCVVMHQEGYASQFFHKRHVTIDQLFDTYIRCNNPVGNDYVDNKPNSDRNQLLLALSTEVASMSNDKLELLIDFINKFKS